MKLAAAVIAIVMFSCSWYSHDVKPAIDAGFSCAKTEASVVAKKVSIASISMAVVSAVATAFSVGTDIAAALDTLIVKQGPALGADAEAIIACATKEYRATFTPSAGIAAGSGSIARIVDTTPSPVANGLDVAIAKHGWKYSP